MTFSSILFKIETGQPLSDKALDKLAKKMYLTPSSSRTFLYTLWILFVMVLLALAAVDGLSPLPPIAVYVIAVVFLIGLILYAFLPKYARIQQYFKAVDTFYETKFSGLDDYDLYYIGQHRSPHVRTLKSNKIYLLTDGHHLLFIDDYFKDTKYPLPRIFGVDKPVFLRVIDVEKNDQSRVLIDISEVEHYLSSKREVPLNKKPMNPKYHRIFETFLDQDPHMDEQYFVTLKLYNGAVFRLGYDSYKALKFAIPLKDKTR
jgi:hypothetical protein